MTDPKLAADEAAQKIISDMVQFAKTDADTAKAMGSLIARRVLAAITRCVCAPSEGMGR